MLHLVTEVEGVGSHGVVAALARTVLGFECETRPVFLVCLASEQLACAIGRTTARRELALSQRGLQCI